MTGHRVLIDELWNPAQPQSGTAPLDSTGFVVSVRPKDDVRTQPRFAFAVVCLWDSRAAIGTTETFGPFGTSIAETF
jgi:hypothetical protein